MRCIVNDMYNSLHINASDKESQVQKHSTPHLFQMKSFPGGRVAEKYTGFNSQSSSIVPFLLYLFCLVGWFVGWLIVFIGFLFLVFLVFFF